MSDRPQRICSVPTCGKNHTSLGYCAMHYQRLHRYGNIDLVYNKHTNRRPPQGAVAGSCGCGLQYTKPRFRVKAGGRPA